MLKESNAEIEIIEYLKNPPNVEELDAICRGLNMEPIELIRTKDKAFKEMGLSLKDNRSRGEWLTLMSDNPSLIERPIVIYKDRYALGQPPEQVKTVLD